MFARKKLLGGLIGLFAAGALLAPVAAAPTPASVGIAASAIANDVGALCTITLDLTWDAASVPGPSANVQLFESVDGGAFTLVGLHSRTGETGSDQFARRRSQPGSSYDYEVILTKGPQHVVGSGAFIGASCSS